MGVDLKWLVLDGYHRDVRPSWAYSHTMMEVGRDYEYHGLLRDLPSEPAPSDFYSYLGRDPSTDPKTRWQDHCYGKTDKTPYGEAIRMVKASDIVGINYADPTPQTRAAIAYLRECPPDTWVALYWH